MFCLVRVRLERVGAAGLREGGRVDGGKNMVRKGRRREGKRESYSGRSCTIMGAKRTMRKEGRKEGRRERNKNWRREG